MNKLIEIYDWILLKIGLVRRGEVSSEEETKEELDKMLQDMGLKILDEKPDPTISIREEKTLSVRPGSAEAQIAGCTCDPVANTDGHGLYAGLVNWKGQRVYAILEGCPVHDG